MNAEAIATTLKQHAATVSPGLPASLTAAHTIGDGIWQGDLGIEIVEAKVPAGYTLVENPTDADRQLVPLDGGPGSHHMLKSLDGVTLYRPAEWGTTDSALDGPFVIFAEPNEIVHEPGHEHPHGTVTIGAPMVIRCRYQRNLTVDERVARAAD